MNEKNKLTTGSIIWGINVIVIILTVFLVSCIIRNNANRSNDNWNTG